MRAHTLLLAMAVVSGHSIALGQDWIGGTGDWFDPANWLGGVVPDTFEEGFFILNDGTAVLEDATVTVGSGVVGGAVGPGRTGDGAIEIRGGDVTLGTGFSILFARDAGYRGDLTITDGAMVSVNTSLELGWRGISDSRIDGGSVVETNRLFVGGRDRLSTRATTADARLDIAGPGTVVRVTQNFSERAFSIGLEGHADVSIRDGAVVEATDVLFVSSMIRDNFLTIDGAGSVLRITDEFDGYFGIGRDVALDQGIETGDAIVTLRDGGTIDMGSSLQDFYITTQGFLKGSGRVLGDVSLFGLSEFGHGTIDPGEDGSFGFIEISGALDVNDNDGNPGATGGVLHFDLGGDAPSMYDRMSVGELLGGGTLEIALVDGYAPGLGDVFEIITITGAMSELGDGSVGFDTIVLPELGGSLFFETLIDPSGVSLRVVPSPGTALALGLMGLGVVRRRRSVS